ncbi:MAG TPA: hypothetical protein VMF89_19005 [Polyangiales bacterium]|nr:hypothetical protein [Polyangiales bacterium]
MSLAAVGCGADAASEDSPQAVTTNQSSGGAGQSAGQSAGAAGRAGNTAGTTNPMPGLGTMMMAANGGVATGGAAGAVARAGAGAAGAPGASAGQSGGAAGASVGVAGAAGSGMMGSAGASGTVAAAGGGAPPIDMMDPTSICAGGEVGMDSDSVMTRGMGGGRNLAVIMMIVPAPNTVSRFVTTLHVPKQPSSRSTLFIWPGLQHSGGADPGRVGNGVLQPVLTWGPSCARSAPPSATSYSSWWVSAMYVNVSTSAAGPTGCAGGDSMDVAVGDRLVMDFFVKDNEWTQEVTNLSNMKKIDFTIDLKGQDQNWVIWDIEVPSQARPAEDTIFEKSVLTFTEPVESCQPTSAAEVDYFSAPVKSPDGKSCCFEKLILKQMRN